MDTKSNSAQVDALIRERTSMQQTHRASISRLIAERDEARRAAKKLAAEVIDLKTNVIAFGMPWAVSYASAFGLPYGHLHPTHYDILLNAGARMDEFIRADIEEAR